MKKKQFHSGKPISKEASSRGAHSASGGILCGLGIIAERCGATAIFLHGDFDERSPVLAALERKIRIFCISKRRKDGPAEGHPGRYFLKVPSVELSRMGQVKVALFLALSKGVIEAEDIVVSLTGPAAGEGWDTLVVTRVEKEFSLMGELRASGALEKLQPGVMERVIDLAMALGREGREGKAVGTIFVIGDMTRLKPRVRQLILNPFRGYEAEQRNILLESLEETVKEFATLDGAFLIREDGVIESCGAHLRISSRKDPELPPGLGSRHHAAAAITDSTGAVSITLSQSTGTVSVFHSGRLWVSFEKPYRS